MEMVLNIESLLYEISKFLTFEEVKTFYSVNKKLNNIFRNNIKEIKYDGIIRCPSIIKKFTHLKYMEFLTGKPADLSILKAESFQKLEKLKITGRIKDDDDSPIEGLKELKTLILISNNCMTYKNISYLRNLNKISVLDLGGNLLKDINVLTQLPSLRSLSLQGCSLTELSILNHKNFMKLEKLYIGLNREIKDYSFLQNLQNLDTLNVYQNNINRIDFIDLLNSELVTEFNLGNNIISDYTPLLRFNNLKNLSLYNNKITSIEFLTNRNFGNLEYLNLDNNRLIKDYNPLKTLKKLKTIKLSNCSITNLSFLKNDNLDEVDSIYLSSNKIEDISFLSSFTKLKYLNLYNNKQQDLNSLNNLYFCEKITELQLGMTKISSMEFLINFKNIKTLNLIKCFIENISFLAMDNLANIEKLSLAKNLIVDASPISNLKQLKILLLNENNIKNIDFLKNNNLLIECLNLSRNEINDFSVLLELPKLETLYIERQIFQKQFDLQNYLDFIEKIKTNLRIFKHNNNDNIYYYYLFDI